MRVTTSKSKNSESFYITQSYTSAQGKSTSKTIRKLGTLADLSKQLHTDREGVLAWANEQARLETLKYKSEKEDATVMIPFHSNRFMDYHKQKLFSGGYLFLQSIYYGLKMDSICRKIKSRHKFEYDLNAILSDLIYTRVLEPSSKSSSFRAAKQFLEPPTYELHDRICFQSFDLAPPPMMRSSSICCLARAVSSFSSASPHSSRMATVRFFSKESTF